MLLSVIVGCSEKVVEGPPVVKYGQAECAECGMILNDERYASAALIESAEGRTYLLFDDIGDQIVHLKKRSPRVIQQFVHDHNTREWIDVEKAFFLKSESFHTPMGSGIVAFRDRTTADARAKDARVGVQNWTDLEKAGR
jgi:copper chaperone NosL